VGGWNAEERGTREKLEKARKFLMKKHLTKTTEGGGDFGSRDVQKCMSPIAKGVVVSTDFKKRKGDAGRRPPSPAVILKMRRERGGGLRVAEKFATPSKRASFPEKLLSHEERKEGGVVQPEKETFFIFPGGPKERNGIKTCETWEKVTRCMLRRTGQERA